jgi:hypothetical protein
MALEEKYSWANHNPHPWLRMTTAVMKTETMMEALFNVTAPFKSTIPCPNP